MKNYRIPKGEEARLPIQKCSTIGNKEKKKSYIDEVISQKSFIPEMSKYTATHTRDWSKKESVGRPKGMFSNSKRITVFEEEANNNKQKVAPDKYETLKAYNLTSRRHRSIYDYKE